MPKPTIDRFRVEYAFLSNFYPAEITMDGYLYQSLEAAYQAAKTDIFQLRVGFQSVSAAKAKANGRKLPLRSDWSTIKLKVMEDLLRQKFSIPSLRKRLLATEDAELVEGNKHGDTFWGVCNGVGENWLGKLLMKIRAEIQEGLAHAA